MMLQNVRETTARTVSDHDSVGRLIGIVAAAALTQAFFRQSLRFDLDWNDWIGYAVGMAASGSPSIILRLIQAKYGKSDNEKKEATP